MSGGAPPARLRLGLVGTGLWARQAHAAAAATHPRVELVGVWGRDGAAAADLAQSFGTTAFPRLEALYDAVEAVAFAVPPDVQAALAPSAARAGQHLMLEKPVALTAEGAAAIERAVLESGVASVVCFSARFVPEYARWLENLASEPGWEGGRVELLSSALSTASGFESSPWRRELGALWDLGPHGLSLLHAVLGDVEAVSALTGPRDQTHLTLRHVGGASSTFSSSLTVPAAAATALSCYFYGAPGRSTLPMLAPGVDVNRAAYHAVLDSLVDQVRLGRRDEDRGLRLGRHVVEVLAAASRSSSDGCVQAVPRMAGEKTPKP